MAQGWVNTGQTADNPFASGLGDRLMQSSAKGFTRANLNGLQEAVSSGRYGTGKKGARNFRAALMPALVKGYGFSEQGEGLTFKKELGDSRQVARLSDYASETLKSVTAKGLYEPHKAIKNFSGPLQAAVTAMNAFSPQAVAGSNMASAWSKEIGSAIGKSFALSTPLQSGFVPFDLVPFVRTIYPVYTPLRNKIPRVPGQGQYHRAKIMSSITGSLPGNLGSLQDDSTSEFFGGSGFSTWPNPLPASGSQSAYDISIPYKFYALTESTSWLAQFSGQGFDDLYGLSSLVLLQEFMLLEEHDMLASTSVPLATPSAPTVTCRAAGSSETALSGVTTNVFVKVAAVNFHGQTIASSAGSASWASGNVADVTISPVPGALNYVVYVTTGASAGTYYQWTTGTQGGSVGGIKFTLQGALPVAGANPLSSDSGTYASTRSESLLSVLSGHAAATVNSITGPYPTGVNAGYYNNAEGATLNVQTIQQALQQMFNGANGFFANPSEIITSPTDAYNLAQSIQNEQVAAYQLRVTQQENSGISAGVAVANVVNPVTRSAPEIMVHPYLPQGNAFLMSYTLPQTQNNLGNVVEMVMVQDYAQIGWPVIDPAFRQSILRYGTFFMPAPQYCGLIQGLQNTVYSSTSSWS